MLFRPEALDAQRQPQLGGMLLLRPLSLSLLTAGVAVAALCVIAFLVLAEYTRKASTAGVLVPDRGLIRLVPAAAGTVLETRVHEGQLVAAGELLFVLAQERALLADGAQAQVERSLVERGRSLRESARQQQRLLDTQQAALQRRLGALLQEQQQIDAADALQQRRLDLARLGLARQEALQSQQFISSAQVQGKQEEVLAIEASALALKRQRMALLREREALEGELRALPSLLAGAAGEIERDLALLVRESAEFDGQRRLLVHAPQAGTVSTLLAQPGQSVGPGAALASLTPAGAVLQAHLYAPSSAVGFVRPQQTVRLRFEAYPYQKYGHWVGRVLQVSRTPLAANELAGLALPAGATAGEPLFRITVALDPAPAGAGQQPVTLNTGMRLHADVLLEKRRLVEWLFEPLLGWRERR